VEKVCPGGPLPLQTRPCVQDRSQAGRRGQEAVPRPGRDAVSCRLLKGSIYVYNSSAGFLQERREGKTAGNWAVLTPSMLPPLRHQCPYKYPLLGTAGQANGGQCSALERAGLTKAPASHPPVGSLLQHGEGLPIVSLCHLAHCLCQPTEAMTWIESPAWAAASRGNAGS
jgi:hypothetical protein